MVKKKSGLSARGKRAVKSGKHIPDSKLDFSDIPESTDEELKKAKRVGRPKKDKTKQLIAIRVDPDLLVIIKKLAAKKNKGYQVLIHELLEKAIKKAA